ncbi:hsp90-like protein [Achlya hypogyna]|uniref:Hsp90-like protein n=1 Tax=Achlya hypogyna TaxID=1202772 RepID=A0A1V9Y9K8_ACHHY|nr:hsp90-like protein [Achlya hypogyna]
MATKKVDANDYSRFDKISDADDADCRNCNAAGARLKCSVCKKANYCNRACQTSDWTYHKRICKKPEPPKKPTPKQAPAASSSASTSSTKTTKSTSAAKASAPKTEVIREDEAIENAKGYKNGLPYFHREQTEHEKALIGDIAPKKIEEVEVATPAHDGSAWNTAGTFEQRDFSKWAKERLEELFSSLEVLQSSMTIRTKPVKDIKGDASVCVIRGKKRFLFDFEFTIEWEAVGTLGKGKLKCHDIGNDGDYEIQCVYDKKPSDTVEAQALHAAVMGKTSGLYYTVVQKVQQFNSDFQAL